MKQSLKRNKYILLLLGITLITALLLVQIRKTGEDYQFYIEESIAFENPWYYEFDDGTSGTVVLPQKLEAGQVETLTLTNVLPELPDAPVSLIFKINHAACQIYLDGELIYDSIAEKDGNGANSWFPVMGTAYTESVLRPGDSGKEITIVLNSDVERYVKSPQAVYIGDRASFVISVVQSELTILIGAITLNIVGLTTLALWIILLITTKVSFRDILCLFFFTFFIAGWEISEVQMIQFFRPNMRFLSAMADEFLMLAPIPIALYFYYSGSGRLKKLAKVAAFIPLCLWVINNVLQLLDLFSLPQTLIVTQIVLVLDTLFIGFIQVLDILEERRRPTQIIGGVYWKFPLCGLCVMVPLIIIALVEYIFRIQDGKSTILVTIAIVAYIISLAFRSAFRLGEEISNAKSASATKTQFLANMSHEIRTPLNAILGFDEIIMRDSKEQRIKEYARSIQDAGESLRDIINTILDMSKIESGKMEIDETGYGVAQQLDGIVDMISELAERKGLDFILDIDENLPAFLLGDNVHIRQVLVNILNNAVKYTNEGSVTFTVKLLEKDQLTNDCLIYFSVKDTGVGIRQEDYDRLFTKFERLDNEQNRSVEGTGLGMSIVIHLLEAMGSKIELDSEYGKGSDFHFVLHQKIIGSSKLGTYEKGASRSVEQDSSGDYFVAPDARILVVDDVPLNVQVTCVLLEVLNMTIDTAESGFEALELIKKNRYDLVLMDHMMPGMNGIQAAQKIRGLAEKTGDSYYGTVPIIALTANAMTGMRETFLDNGMQDYISKPVDGRQLIASVRKWLPKEKIQYQEPPKEARDTKPEAWDINIPGINADAARTYFPNREEYKFVLATFFHAVASNVEKIRKARENKKLEEYCITAHGLKSSAKVIGANDLSEKAKNLEDAAHQGDLEVINRDTDALLEEYMAMAEGIEAYLSCFATEETHIDGRQMMNRLDTLYEIAVNFDMDGLLHWEKDNSTIQVDEKFALDWSQIIDMVQNVSFTEIADKIDEIRNRE